MNLETALFVFMFVLGVIEGISSLVVHHASNIRRKGIIYASLAILVIGSLVGMIEFAKRSSFSWEATQNAFLINGGGVIIGTLIFTILSKLKLFGLKDEGD
ncbi:MAG: hypothetical protein LBL41_04125 [Bifidobacteriaceae bacterium]|jgi:hypothetical protein|nr:hypothetical protein [Bifidobacteriaceae bacterium]